MNDLRMQWMTQRNLAAKGKELKIFDEYRAKERERIELTARNHRQLLASRKLSAGMPEQS